MKTLRERLLSNVAHRHLLFIGPDGDGDDNNNGGAGGDNQQQQDDGSGTANAKTINHNDPDPEADPPPSDEGGDDQGAGEGDTGADDAGAGEEENGTARSGTVPREIMLRRVGQQARKLAAKDQEIADLKAKLASGTAKPGGEGDDGNRNDQGEAAPISFKSKEEFDRHVAQEAARQNAENEFNRRCNELADAGEAAFGKEAFNEALENLRLLDDKQEIPLRLLDAALAADVPEQALHELGKNPEKAERILALPPAKMIAEVVKIGMKKSAPAQRQRSQTPAPSKPLAGGGGASDDAGLGDNVSDDEWLKNRTKQVQANRLRAARGGAGG